MSIDLNADAGEGLSEADAPRMLLVSSVDIAFGSHAGDKTTMRAPVALAHRHGLRFAGIDPVGARARVAEAADPLRAAAASLS